MATTFKDKDGREWALALDVAAVEKLEARVEGFKIDGLLLSDGLFALFDAPLRFVRVLWVLCEGQAERHGVTPEQFGAALDWSALDVAGDAFTDALVLFTPRHRRAGAAAAVAEVREQRPETDRRTAERVRAIVRRELLSAPATSAPASSDSTPAPPG